MNIVEIGKPEEPWVEPGFVGGGCRGLYLLLMMCGGSTLTGVTGKHLWLHLITLKSVPVRTGLLTRTPLVCMPAYGGEQRQKGRNIESQQSRGIKDWQFSTHKRVSDAELFLD